MNRSVRSILILLLVIFISSCAKPRPVKLPPVTDGWHKHSAVKNAYIVQKKDTLYSVAWAFGLDYRYLANINNLQPPYALRCGQRLYIAQSSKSLKKYEDSVRGLKHHDFARIKPLSGWFWPTTGKVVAGFNNKPGGNKGVDIAGSYGQAIFASNDGKVVYSGTGIRSYGKLLIIKHNDDYLSAYAYNKWMLVHEGDEVKARQKISTMGKDDEGRVRLHFEIRRFGVPIDPLLYILRK